MPLHRVEEGHPPHMPMYTRDLLVAFASWTELLELRFFPGLLCSLCK